MTAALAAPGEDGRFDLAFGPGARLDPTTVVVAFSDTMVAISG